MCVVICIYLRNNGSSEQKPEEKESVSKERNRTWAEGQGWKLEFPEYTRPRSG